MTGTTRLSAPRLDDAIARARDWLFACQDANGSWRDFDLDVGESTSWVTTVVVIGLSATSDTSTAAEPCERACRFLLASMRLNGGWGYNETVSIDCDTTAHAVIALSGAGIAPPPVSLECLRAFQAKPGRFQTFPKGHRFQSWQLVHDEVGAVAAIALQDRAAAITLRRVGLAEIAAHGELRSFWWSHPVYATYAFSWLLDAFSIAACQAGQTTYERLKRTVAFDSSLLTAFSALSALYLRDTSRANRAISELLSLQTSAGAWRPSRLLRYPYPDCVEEWHDCKSAHGTIVEDSRGVYGTAVALRALALAMKHGTG